MFARCIPQRRSAGLFGCMARISCQNKLNLNTCRRYVATNRCFSRPRSLRERIRAISCHGRQRGNASGRYLAMARRRMIATEVHRRPISDCNGDKRPMPKTPFMLLKGLIAFLSAMWFLPKLLITLRRRLTSTMKPAHKDAPRGNAEGKEEP